MAQPPYKAIDIARHILTYYRDQNRPISNLQLQKLLYFSWIDYYRETGKYLFEDSFIAWKLGPVVRDVYYRYRPNAGMPIFVTDDADLGKETAHIESICNRYAQVSVAKLVDKSHKKGHAWDIIYDDGAGIDEVIPFDLIITTECQDAS